MNYFSQKHEYNHWFLLDFVLILIALTGLAFVRGDILTIGLFVFLPIYFFLTQRTYMIGYLVIASAISILWQSIAGAQYGYNHDMIKIFYFDAYPLFAWAIGLTSLYTLYLHVEKYFKIQSPIFRFFIFFIIYWGLLLPAENIAYHQLNIQNIATTGYPPLPFCNCLHVPIWMQIWYLTAGLGYFVLCKLSKYSFEQHFKNIPALQKLKG